MKRATEAPATAPAMLKAEAVIFSLERPALFEIGLKAKK
jgi:hypothetical protein